MNTTLKKTLVTTVLAFSAGAACAGSITLFSYEDTLSPEQFLERSTVLLEQVADIGAHVAGTRDGRTFLRSAPPVACIPPPNPKRPILAKPRKSSVRLTFIAAHRNAQRAR